MKLVICLSPGPWQTIIMGTSLRKIYSESFLKINRIVLINFVKEQQRQLEKANKQLFDDLQLWSEFYSFEISGHGLDITEFNNFLIENNLKNADQIVLRSTTFPVDKVMACLQRKASLIITEDGSQTWFKTESVLPPKKKSDALAFKIKESAKHAIVDLIGINYRILPSPNSSRYFRKFSTFPTKNSIDTVGPNWEELTKNDLHHVLERVNHKQRIQLDPKKFLVFLGGNFSEGRYLRPDEEYSLYYKHITELINLGFDVIYKPHPRANKMYDEYLELKINSSRFSLMGNEGTFPIECLVNWTDQHIVVGAITSSLWYLKKIYGIQCFTIFDEFYCSLISSRSSVMGKIASETISDIPYIESLVVSKNSA